MQRSSRRQLDSERGILAVLAGSIVAVSVLMHDAGLAIVLTSAGSIVFALVFAVLATIRWHYHCPASRAARIARDAAEYVGLTTALLLIGAVASYPVAALSHGFSDTLLLHSDKALHFDWLAWYRFTAAHPLLQLASRASYELIYISPAVLLGYYALTNQRREAYALMAALWFATTITLIAFWFMPAVGPFATLWQGPVPYLPISELWQPDLIPKLRAHQVSSVDPGHLVGLVSAPSFHAAAAILFIGFAARQPTLRLPLIVANIAMLVSTPVEGTHYLTDLLLGAFVALISFAAVTLTRRTGRFASRLVPAGA